MEGMPKPEVQLEVRLLPEASGGRRTAIRPGLYKGVVSVPAGNFSVRWALPEGLSLHPGGESALVEAQFLYPEDALPHFPVGATFGIWEGRIIGSGSVVQLRGGA